jgi:ERCC4-type nuclease
MHAIVQVDTREQKPLDIQEYSTEMVTLPVGDYGIRGFSNWDNPQFICERKSMDDLVASVTAHRKRFMREVKKLRQFSFHALLIEACHMDVAQGQYRSQATPQSILQTLAALQVRADLHVVWCGDHEGAARILEGLVRQFVRGIEKDYQHLQQASETPAAATGG